MSSSEAPIVSVVIPVFNAELFIEESIKSVLNQTYPNLELIIINDGSTDDSVSVINALLTQMGDKRTTFISRGNLGVCRTLNEGLALSRGKYFSYIGADDIWEPRKLEFQISEMERGDFGAAFANSWIIDSEGDLLGRFGYQYSYHGGNIYDDLVWGRFHPPSPTVLFRRDVVESVGAFDESHVVEDWDLWIRIARGHQVLYINKPLAFYRRHTTNLSGNLEIGYAYSVAVLEKTIGADEGLAPHRGRLRANFDALQSGAYFEQLRFPEARRYALKALSQNLTNRMAWRSLLGSFLGTSVVSLIRGRRRKRVVEILKKENYLR